MSIIRQSTARTILVGPVLDSAGAAKTDEVVGNIKVAKNGTVAGANGSATLTHDHAGKYKLALTTSDTDTVGVLEISLNSGTNDMPVARLNVVEEAVFDAYFAASATMPVTLAADAITASVFDESTAFPLKSADTGSTAVARGGANGGTLETLSDQIDTIDVDLAAVKLKTDALPASPAAVGSEMTLTAAYDAAKTAASQTSVDDLPTNAELAAALAGAYDAVLSAIAALNNLSAAGAQAAAGAALAAYGAALETTAQSIEDKADALPSTTDIADAILAAVADGTLTVAQVLRIVSAALAGKVTGAGGTTVTIRDPGDTVDRVIATVDEFGNRATVVLDLN